MGEVHIFAQCIKSKKHEIVLSSAYATGRYLMTSGSNAGREKATILCFLCLISNIQNPKQKNTTRNRDI